MRLITWLRLIIWLGLIIWLIENFLRYQVDTNYWHFLEVIVVNGLLGLLLLRIHVVGIVQWIDHIAWFEDKLVLVTQVISNMDTLDMTDRTQTDLGMKIILRILDWITF